MQCVKCGTELKTLTVDGVEVDRCPSCSGIWFDAGELDKVLEQGRVEALRNEVANNEGHDAKKAACPRCGSDARMLQVASLKAAGVHIDTCPLCFGQWLDGGELEELTKPGFLERVRGLFS